MVIVILLFALFFNLGNTNSYAIVIDAGTTSTKIRVFTWTDVMILSEECYQKVKPGISAFWDNFTRIDEQFYSGIHACLNDMGTPIPEAKKKHTPIYFGATSASRLLNNKNATHSKNMMQHIRTFFRSRFKKYKFESRYVRILSGEEEAIFGWINTQLLLDNQFNRTRNGGLKGALDMGGGSVQITFLPDEEIMESKVFVNVKNKVFPLYGFSFIRFGQDEGYKQSKEYLVELYGISTPIAHPCLFLGLTDNDSELGVLFNGTSDPTECAALVRSIMGRNSFCIYGDEDYCSVNGKYLTRIQETKEFYAFNGFYYMADGLDIQSPTTLQAVWDAAESFCQNDFAQAQLVTNMMVEYMDTQCYNLYHNLILLMEKFHIDSQSQQIIFSNDVNSKSVSWPAGLLFFETESLATLSSVTQIEERAGAELVAYQASTWTFMSLFIVMTVLFCIALIAFIVALIFCCFEANDDDDDEIDEKGKELDEKEGGEKKEGEEVKEEEKKEEVEEKKEEEEKKE